MISETFGRGVKCKYNYRLMAVKRKWHHPHRDWFRIDLAFTVLSSLPIQLEEIEKPKDEFRHKGSTSPVSDQDRKGGGVFPGCYPQVTAGQPEYLWKLKTANEQKPQSGGAKEGEVIETEVKHEWQTGIRLTECVKVCSLAHMCVSSNHSTRDGSYPTLFQLDQ